jgi:hypothetical protein
VTERIWTPGRKWDGVIDIEPSPNKSFVTEDGRHFQDSVVTISVEWAAELHAGYRCARCLEGLHDLGAFPDRCPLCRFEVAKYQRQMLEEQYRGVETLPSGVPMDREREILEQELHRPKGKATMAVPKERRN